MPPITRLAKNLPSRQIRKTATGGKPRRLNLAKSFLEQQQGGGLIQRAWNAGKSLANFITASIDAFRRTVLSAKNIFQQLVGGFQRIWNFNWNASDAELQAIQKSGSVAVASAWGTAVGRVGGWVAGIAIGYGVSMLCPVIGGAALARAVSLAVAPEALQEIGEGIFNAIRVTASATAQNVAIGAFINFRKNIRKMPQEKLAKIVGEKRAKMIREEWGKEGGPIISLAEGRERWVERFKKEETRAFMDAAADEFGDAFIEAGFIVAAEIDNAYEQARAATDQSLGQTRVIELQPDRRNDEEKILLYGEEKLLKPQILSTLANYRVLNNRDVGQIVGSPVDDDKRAKWLNRKLLIVFRDKPTPPWRHPDGRRCKQAEYSISDLKPGTTWRDIKQASKRYTWGKFRATARLDNGRQIAVYGFTEQEAESKLKDLMRLSTADILSLNVSEEKIRNPRNRKEPTLMYPCFASFLIRKRSTDQQGLTDLRGQVWDEKLIKFNLWTDTPPEDLPPLL